VLKKKNQSALLAKYFDMYKKNPRSKVFAPLAESFRKLGMYDDAFKVLKDGIRHHPNYVLGYIVLAHCYFDQDKFELTYNTLRPIVGQNADNISLQKIFAQSCMNLGYLEEALDTYKYLLFMNPKDKFFSEQVKRLEDDLMIGHKKLSLEQLIQAPEMERLPTSQAVDDDWVQVDFNQQAEENLEQDIKQVPAPEDDENWVMNKPGLEQHPILKEESIISRSLEDDFYADEFESEEDVEHEVTGFSESPIISHTLIDLYCSQQYFDKAIELLHKILELNPEDRASTEKLNQVLEMKASSNESSDLKTEEEGHEQLIQLIETQVKKKSEHEIKLEHVLNKFLQALKTQAQAYR
jgi:pentatricopeptide repeat protein